MLKNKKYTSDKAFILGAFIGLIIFIAIYGVDIIRFTNDSMIINGYIEKDVAQHYAGWMLYRSSPWQFPLGLAKNIAYPYGTTVSYTDSIPLLAIFFKLFSNILPQTFQYFGSYCMLCFVLQGAFGALLSNLFSEDLITDLSAAVIFVLSPVMIERAFRHCALTSHFLILAALYYYFKNKNSCDFKAYLPFIIINILAIAIHPYFLPFTFAIMFAFCAEKFIWNKKYFSSVLYLLGSIAISLVVGYVEGAFYSADSFSSFGYGFFNMNLNAFINPASRGFENWSSVLPVRPNILGQPEGFNYLGIGIMVFIPISALMYFIHYKLDIFKTVFTFIFKYFGIIFSTAALFVFAVGDWIMFDEIQIFRIPFPTKLMEGLFGIFRANGRFTWLLVYCIALAVIFGLSKINNKLIKTAFLTALILVQCYDLKDVLASKHAYFTGTEGDMQGQVYNEILKNSIWDDMAEKYKVCSMISSGIPNSGIEIAVKFGKNGHASNTAFEARVDYEKADELYAQMYEHIHNGTLDPDTIVMINSLKDDVLQSAIRNGYSVFEVETDYLVCVNKFTTAELNKYISEGQFTILNLA